MASITDLLPILGALGLGAVISWLLSLFGQKQRAKGAAEATEALNVRLTRYRNALLMASKAKADDVRETENARIRKGLSSAEAADLIRHRNDSDDSR